MNYQNLIPRQLTTVTLEDTRVVDSLMRMKKARIWLKDNIDSGTYTELLYKDTVIFKHDKDALMFALVFGSKSVIRKDLEEL